MDPPPPRPHTHIAAPPPQVGYAVCCAPHPAAPKTLQQPHSAAEHATKGNILPKHKGPGGGGGESGRQTGRTRGRRMILTLLLENIQQILQVQMHVISLLGHVFGVQVGLGEV